MVLKALVGDLAITDTVVGNLTTSSPEVEESPRLLYCGANDCQDANKTAEAIELYTPEYSTLVVLLISLAIISFAGCVIHWFLIPNIDIKGIRIS